MLASISAPTSTYKRLTEQPDRIVADVETSRCLQVGHKILRLSVSVQAETSLVFTTFVSVTANSD
jgi:hypothetical protein